MENDEIDWQGLLSVTSDTNNVLSNKDRQQLSLETRNLEESEETDSSSSEEEDGIFNIARFMGEDSDDNHLQKKPEKKVELEPHLHPDTLICRDAMDYMHLMVGSNNMPTASFGENDLGFTPKMESKRTFGGNSRWNKNFKDSLYYHVKEIVAEIDIHHNVFGTQGECSRKTFGVLSKSALSHQTDLQHSVIKGIPVKSPLYMYSMKISRRKNDPENRYMGYNVWNCDSCNLIKKPLSNENIIFFAYNLVNLDQHEVPLFQAELIKLHPELQQNIDIDFTWKDFETVMKNIKLGEGLAERPIPELIRYIYCNQIEFLSKFYKERVLLNMSPIHIEALYNKLREKPFELFFFKMTPYTFRVYKKLSKASISSADNQSAEVEKVSIEEEVDESSEEVEDEEDSMREFLDQLTFNRDIVFRSKMNYSLKHEIFWLFLPEIADTCIELIKEKLTDFEIAIIRVYSTLKKSYHSEFNSFEYKWGLMQNNFNFAKNPDEMFELAMKWLTETPMRTSKSHQKYNGYVYTIVKKLGTGYYLRESHLNTMAILESIQLLFDRYIKYSLRDGDEKEREDELRATLGPDADKFLYSSLTDFIKPAEPNITSEIISNCCSEQLRAVYLHKDSPMLMICGMAGSGKTTVLKKIMECYPKGKVLACAFMGRNVAALAKVFDGMAFTCHMLLYMHKKACATESWSTSNSFRKKSCEHKAKNLYKMKECNGMFYKRCPFEDIEVLVIDEMSLMTEELFGSVLSVFLKCSKLTKLVLSGDVRQLPPLGSGSAMKEMKKFCEHMGLLIEFTHNHRVDPHARLLFENCIAIADGKVNNIRFDGTACIHEYYKADYSETPCFDYGREAAKILSKYDLEMDKSVILTRSNNVRESINPVVDKLYRGEYCDERTWRKDNLVIHENSKIVFKKNLYLKDNVLINNEQLIVTAIEDYKPTANYDRNGQGAVESSVSQYKKKISKYQQEMQSAIMEVDNVIPVNNTYARRAFPGSRRRLRVSSLDHIARSVDNKTRVIPFFGNNRRKVQKAYAITIHGAQGGEYEAVILMMPYNSDAWTRECIYTAMTRAKKKFILVGDLLTFNQAIERKEKERMTDLGFVCIKNIAGRIPEGWAKWKAPDLYQEVLFLESMEQLPDVDIACQLKDLWIDLFGYMIDLSMENIKQVYRMRKVCKSFREKIDSKAMWLRIYKSIYTNTDPMFRDFLINPEKMLEKSKNDLSKLAWRVINSIGAYSWKLGCKHHPSYLLTSYSLISAIYKHCERNPDAAFKNCDKSLLFFNVQVCSCGLKMNIYLIYSDNPMEDDAIPIQGKYPRFATPSGLPSNARKIDNKLMEAHPDKVATKIAIFKEEQQEVMKKKKRLANVIPKSLIPLQPQFKHQKLAVIDADF